MVSPDSGLAADVQTSHLALQYQQARMNLEGLVWPGEDAACQTC